MKSGWWVPRYGFDIDYGFGFISWWSTYDRWWAFGYLNPREMASEARNDVSWHDESISGIWERNSILRSYWKMFLYNENENPWILRFDFQRYCWTWHGIQQSFEALMLCFEHPSVYIWCAWNLNEFMSELLHSHRVVAKHTLIFIYLHEVFYFWEWDIPPMICVCIDVSLIFEIIVDKHIWRLL